MLIEPGNLQKKLKKPNLRILDTRKHADYVQSHIPGAVWVNVQSWQQLASRDGGLRDSKGWGQKIGDLGVDRDSLVVVYGSELPEAARAWWLLKYVRMPNVTLLDGGWPLWSRERRPTSTSLPSFQAVRFKPRFQADRLEEIDSLKKSLRSGQVTVVDARSRKEFTGQDIRHNKRGGHIIGAKHLEWKDLLTEDGRFKSAEQLRKLFHERGIELEQTAVTC